MKKKSIFLLACFYAAIAGMQTVEAQSWNITGNNNTTALSRLGTTNFIPLGLYTNNQERVHIDETGKVGIGIATPVNILTVKSTAGNPVATWMNGLTSPVFVGFADNASSEFVLSTASNVPVRRSVIQGRRSRGTLAVPAAVENNDYLTSFLASGFDGNTFQNPATIDFFVDGTPTPGNVPARISFVTGSNQGNRAERLKVGSTGNFNFNDSQLVVLQGTGNIGIGTVLPENKLHIVKGSAGFVTGYAQAPLVVENSTNNYINLLAPTANETGILFGNPTSNISGGIIYRNSGSPLGFQFRTHNNNTQMVLTQSGNLGLGTIAPATKLHVAGDISIEGNGNGLFFRNGSSAITDAPEGTVNALRVHADLTPNNNGFRHLGTADFSWLDVWATDLTINASDARLKENVENLSYGLNEVLKLRPVTYNWIKYKEEGKRIGLIAQEVQKIIPEMVKDSRIEWNEETGATTRVAVSKLGITYDALIPVLVKAIQEQNAKIEELTRMVQELAKDREPLSVRPVKGFLGQNTPNPPVSNSTRISYSLPEGVQKAELVITDAAGRKLKQIRLNNTGDGYVNVNTSLLSKGTYSYSLYVNGVLADSKKMVLVR